MKKKLTSVGTCLFLVGIFLAVTSSGWSQDRIYVLSKGKEIILCYGTITTMTATAINIERQGTKGGSQEVATNEITRIQFNNSSDQLKAAQKSIIEGDFDAALESLEKDGIDDGHRREITEEIAFDLALCNAQIALSGRGEPIEAGRMMLKFVQNNPNNFHYYQACGLLGDLLVAAGNMKAAQDFYGKLAQAPWPDYKMKAQIALGRAYLALNQPADADKSFDEALANEATGDLAENQRLLARVGKARCQILAGKADTAMRTAKEMLSRSDDRNPELQASSYNAMGAALRKMNKPKEAILAFLHTHLMYSNLPEADAEAVANLEQLFTQTHNAAHAQDMRQLLDDRYKNSRWAHLNK